jgi:hypothetical protein
MQKMNSKMKILIQNKYQDSIGKGEARIGPERCIWKKHIGREEDVQSQLDETPSDGYMLPGTK